MTAGAGSSGTVTSASPVTLDAVLTGASLPDSAALNSAAAGAPVTGAVGAAVAEAPVLGAAAFDAATAEAPVLGVAKRIDGPRGGGELGLFQFLKHN